MRRKELGVICILKEDLLSLTCGEERETEVAHY